MTGKAWAMVGLAGVLAVWSCAAVLAQTTANGEFAPQATLIVEKSTPGEPDTEKPEEKDATGLGQRREREVTLAEQLSFRERQVREEMSELEQRMFRLSEALKKLEPENSSRLIIGLKYAREELIQHQMQEVEQALATLQLKGAADDQKQLMLKLERLQQLLLSTDLDFEMRLERLRQIREALRQLDTVIKEESREEKVSKKAAELEKQLASLAKRKATLDELIRQQAKHVEQNTPLAKAENLSDDQRGEVDKLGKAQEGTRKDTQTLAGELTEGASSKNLTGAAASMQSAVGALEKTSPAEALPPMQEALSQLKKESEDLARQQAEAEQALAQEKFDAMRKDQQGNRQANDDVSEMTRQLGSSGTAALAELLHASSSMSNAEGAFANSQAGAGNGEQGKALASLKYAKELLAEEAERLANQLRAEVKKRVTEGLTQMLEMQTAVRERTEKLAPAVKKESREALAAIVALAKREEKIVATAQDLINIVEETEFGIALPAALAAVRDAAESVQVSLADGDASSDVIRAEKQIEADLKAMLEIVSEMSEANSKKGRRQRGNSPDEQRKELNRIISELRMLKLLEERVKESTTMVDAKRAGDTSLSAEIRKRVEHLEGRQADIQEATELLNAERGDEVPESE
jgi:hypothetical protein